MATIFGFDLNRFDRFFPKSATDPRSALPLVTERPPYWLGADWTPSDEQVAQARARQLARRSDPALARWRWRKLSDPAELNAARTVMVCATVSKPENRVSNLHSSRIVRDLVFDERAEIFMRELYFSSKRYLLELRHPELSAHSASPSIGLRFLGLFRPYWRSADDIGVWLDGDLQRLYDVLTPDFNAEPLLPTDPAEPLAPTLEDRIADYVHFIFDHAVASSDSAETTSFHVIGDGRDFLPDPPALAVGSEQPVLQDLAAQFRIVDAPLPTVPTSTIASELAGALKLAAAAIVPPTLLHTVTADAELAAHAVVFTTIVHRGFIYHNCWRVFNEGKIDGIEAAEQCRTAENDQLPLIELHSFTQQHKALADLSGVS